MSNQECKVRPAIVNVNSNESLFYSLVLRQVNDPYAKLCVPDIVKNLNIKVFNLMQELMKQDI